VGTGSVRTHEDAAPASGSAVARCDRLRFAGLLAVVLAATSCTPSAVMSLEPRVDIGAETSSVVVAGAAPAGRGLQALVPSNPYMAGYPRYEPPMMSQPFSEPSVMPADEVECRRQLKRIGAVYRDLDPINDGGACRVDWPVQLIQLSGGIQMKPAATVTCQMALAFASWTKEELAPNARMRYFSGVKTIHQGSSYSCRNIRGTRTASEHSKGNAIDVMRIELNSGRDIDVRKPGFFAFRQKRLLANVRKGGCQYFNTVLGPGYDRDHADHFHFDVKERRNGYVACR
jgi:hypothetical protein